MVKVANLFKVIFTWIPVHIVNPSNLN